MSDSEIGDLRAAILRRLRFERDLGLEAVAPKTLDACGDAPELPSQAETFDAADAQALTGLSPAEKSKRWEALEARAKACTLCFLHKGRTQVVFGDGNREAKLVFVGEGPGEDEDRQGLPFVGRAGQLLNKIIGAMGFERRDVYICNIVKCRPPGNRTPLPDEVALCAPYLEEQLALLAPKAIVTLGAPATKLLLNTTQGITSLRGRWRMYKDIRVMPTYHPAFVLRQYTPKVRKEVWEDMQQVMKFLDA